MTRATLFLLAVLGCMSSSALRGNAQATATLRVATLPIDGGAQVFYAKDMGFFAKSGLDVQILPIQNSGAIAGAVASNAVDIGYVNVTTLAAARRKNVELIAIAPGAVYSSTLPTTALLVTPAAQIRTARDLTGKIVATQGLGTINEYGARAWIDRNGGDSTTVKFVEVAFSEMPTALETGRVDAAVLAEPYLTPAKKTLRVLASPFDAIGREVALSVWTTTPQWAKDHPDLVRRYAAVMRQTAVWANANQPQSGQILAKYTRIDPALVATMMRAHYAEELTEPMIQTEIDVAAKYGKFRTLPAKDLIYEGVR